MKQQDFVNVDKVNLPNNFRHKFLFLSFQPKKNKCFKNKCRHILNTSLFIMHYRFRTQLIDTLTSCWSPSLFHSWNIYFYVNFLFYRLDIIGLELTD